MIRKNFWLSDYQVKSLNKLEGNVTEHVRRAIDEYLARINEKKLKVSKSPSKNKGMLSVYFNE